MPGTSRATIPFFSPDGSRVGYTLEGNTEIRVVSLTGAPPITVADSGIGADGGTWSEDGFIYFDGLTGGGTTGLVRVPASGSKVLEQVTTVDTAKGEQDHFWPNALPEGRGVLFTDPEAGERRAERARGAGHEDHEVPHPRAGHHRPVQPPAVTSCTSPRLANCSPRRSASTGSRSPVSHSRSPAASSGGPSAPIDLVLSTTGTLMYLSGTGETEPSEIVYVNRDGTNTKIDSALHRRFPDARIVPRWTPARDQQGRWDGTAALDQGPARRPAQQALLRGKPEPSARLVSRWASTSASSRNPALATSSIASAPMAAAHGTADRLSRPRHQRGIWSRDGQWLVFRTAAERHLRPAHQRRHHRSSRWCRPPSMRSCPRFRPMGAGWRIRRTNPAPSRSMCAPSPMPSRPGGRCRPTVASIPSGVPTAANCSTGPTRSCGRSPCCPARPSSPASGAASPSMAPRTSGRSARGTSRPTASASS